MHSVPAVPVHTDDLQRIESYLKLKSQRKVGAHWFYWIAALSLINSGAVLLDINWSFALGLGFTQVSDGLVGAFAADLPRSAAVALRTLGFGFDLIIAGVFALFGWFAVRGHSWSFIAGMALYLLDALIFVLVGDVLSIALHVFAFGGLLGGLRAHKQLLASQTGTIPVAGNVAAQSMSDQITPVNLDAYTDARRPLLSSQSKASFRRIALAALIGLSILGVVSMLDRLFPV